MRMIGTNEAEDMKFEGSDNFMSEISLMTKIL